MHSMTVGKTRIHFNGDFSGEVTIDKHEGDIAGENGVSVPFVDLEAFVKRANAERSRSPGDRKNGHRAAALAEVKTKITKQLQTMQEAEREPLARKMLQVAINAVNGAR